MLSAKNLLIVSVLLAAAAGLVASNRKTAPAAPPEQKPKAVSTAISAPPPPVVVAEIPVAESQPQDQIVANEIPRARAEAQPVQPRPQPVAPPKKTAAQTPPRATGKPPIQDPTARIALSSVGVDPDAEEYWVEAINDPSLSAHERQDLIEDLNEDGLSDPKHPSPEDLPLILNRLQLIEELAPDAMDQVNWDAFKEAYKDLMNLWSRAQE
ncbi:hypothetical protein ACXR0O_08265 [Verrucomicrobiota bacterium sgz303538]